MICELQHCVGDASPSTVGVYFIREMDDSIACTWDIHPLED